jgi:hypothetical protein
MAENLRKLFPLKLPPFDFPPTPSTIFLASIPAEIILLTSILMNYTKMQFWERFQEYCSEFPDFGRDIDLSRMNEDETFFAALVATHNIRQERESTFAKGKYFTRKFHAVEIIGVGGNQNKLGICVFIDQDLKY